MKRALAVVLAVAAAVAVGQEGAQERQETAPPRLVQTETVERGRIEKRLDWSGTIEARSAVLVMPKVAGEIVELAVEVGDKVEKGHLLAAVEDETLRLAAKQAEAKYAAARIAHEQAQALARTRAQARVADAQAAAEAARKALETAEKIGKRTAQLKAAQAQAALDAAQAGLNKLKAGARSEEREQARSALSLAEANLKLAEKAYGRAQRLFDEGALSERDREAAETAFDVARARRDTASEALNAIENGARLEDIDAMQAQAAQAQAALDLAMTQINAETWETDLQAAKTALQLAESGEKIALAQENALSWKAEIDTARANRALAEASWELAKKQWMDAVIAAPIAGVVSERRAELGGVASPSSPVFEIMDIQTVKAVVDVIDADLPSVSLGMRVQISAVGAPSPVEGHVYVIPPKLNPVTRSARVEIVASNKAGALRPGMFASVSAAVEERVDAVVVPLSAVVDGAVFVSQEGIAVRRQVLLGLRDGDRVEVTEGLNGGELLIVAGQRRLSDGDPVRSATP